MVSSVHLWSADETATFNPCYRKPDGSARRPQALLFALFVSRRPYSHLGIHTYARCRGGEETRIVRCETKFPM